jgi:hypothetical protein
MTKLSPQNYKALFSGLSKAFKVSELESMLERELGKSLEDLIIMGGPKAPTRPDVVREVIDVALREDWARHLLIAALVAKPNDPGLGQAKDRILEGAQKPLPGLLRIIRDPGFDLDEGYVTRCYELCAGLDAGDEPVPVPEYGGGRSTLDYCYALAESLVRRDRTHPFLGFVTLLRNKVGDAGVKDRLTEWLADARRRLGAVSRAPERREPPAPGVEKRYLLVRVRDVDMDPGKYAIQAWLWGDDAGSGLLQKEVVVEEAEIEGVLDSVREALVGRKINLKEVVVEVFLPRVLLSARDRAVDQWRINPYVGRSGQAAKLSVTLESYLGSEHVVVVRPVERISYGQALIDAQSRWERARRIAAGFTVLDSAHRYRGKKLVAVRIKNGAGGVADIRTITRKIGVICCLFDREPGPPPAPREPAIDPLAVWILDGVPAALWLRRPPDGIDADEQLCRLVRDRTLDELPEWAFDLRTDPEAPREGWHPSRALTLLYDDPARVPPEADEQSTLQYP